MTIVASREPLMQPEKMWANGFELGSIANIKAINHKKLSHKTIWETLETIKHDNVGIIATLIALLMFYDGKLLAFGLIKYLNHHQSDSSCKLCITASELGFWVDRTFSFCSQRQPDERLVWLPRSITSPAFVYSTGGMSTTQFNLARTSVNCHPIALDLRLDLICSTESRGAFPIKFFYLQFKSPFTLQRSQPSLYLHLVIN